MNYNMQGMDKTIPELFAMLKAAEVEIKKEHQVLMVNKTTSFKKKGKGDRGEGVPIFRWDDNYQFGGDDFDNPTTNVHDVAP